MDYTQHNEEVRQVWQAYRAGHPIRVPMNLVTDMRWYLLDPELNREGITWQAYLNDPELMFEVYLKYAYAMRHRIPYQDAILGIPEEGWSVTPFFANIVDEAWFGCEIIYPEGQAAATIPRFAGKHKFEVLERGIPGPFDGFMGKIREYYELFKHLAAGREFYGKPVNIGLPHPLSFDGLLTVANGLRGPELFEDMLADEEYYHSLMDLVTEASIRSIKAWRELCGVDPRPLGGGIADDAIQFISTALYKEKVLPYHKRFVAALYGEGPLSMHLCGNVQRHLPTIIRELNVRAFDTGFPINFNTLRDQVGDDVEIRGGVRVPDLLSCSPDEIYAITRNILSSGIKRGGKFIMAEANDLAPRVPLANLEAMYRATQEFGLY
jgi:uroporphyrinogen-III decarboxylase